MKGSKRETSNYWPVSLTSVVCKTLEHLVRADIMKNMWENKLLSDYQHGFVEGRSCTSQLPAVLEAWTRILDSGNAVDAIYLDFRKAFDTVPHRHLLAKLEGYGVTGKCLAWINAFLDDRKQRVIINRGGGDHLGNMLLVIYPRGRS